MESGFLYLLTADLLLFGHVMFVAFVVVGLALILIGVGFELAVAVSWIRSGYGPLTAMREVVFGLVSIGIGLQTVFASFLVSLLSLDFVAPSSIGDT